MTLEEFLRWEDGTDTRYELIRGVPVARPIQPAGHGMLLARLCSLFDFERKARSEYVALVTAAIPSPSEPDSCYLADLVIKPAPLRWDRQLTPDPMVIIEVVSDTTVTLDREIKLPDYLCIPSAQEILLLDAQSIRAELYQRRGFDWSNRIVTGLDGTIRLPSVGIEISMSDLYEGFEFPEDEV